MGGKVREMSAVGWFSWSALPTPRFLPLEHLLSQGYLPDIVIVSASKDKDIPMLINAGVGTCEVLVHLSILVPRNTAPTNRARSRIDPAA